MCTVAQFAGNNRLLGIKGSGSHLVPAPSRPPFQSPQLAGRAVAEQSAQSLDDPAGTVLVLAQRVGEVVVPYADAVRLVDEVQEQAAGQAAGVIGQGHDGGPEHGPVVLEIAAGDSGVTRSCVVIYEHIKTLQQACSPLAADSAAFKLFALAHNGDVVP